METIARGITYADLMHRGRPRIIATAILQSPGGVALVDPGPTSCLDTLRASLDDAGIGIGDLRALLLTHIHLDHAGAAGSLLAENPDPSEEDIRIGLSGNLCRCTGYTKVFDAVTEAAAVMRGEGGK